MDPVSVGFIAAVAVIIIFISLLIFKLFPRESDFEKAYGANALRLLADDRTNKAKNVKNRNKPKAAEKKKDNGDTKELNNRKNGTETRPQAAKVVGNGALKESYYNNYEKENMDEKNKKKNKNKHLNEEARKVEREKPVLFTDEIDVSQDEKRDEHTAKTADDVDSAVFAQHSEQTHVADIDEKRARKKHRARRADDHTIEVPVEEVKHVQSIQMENNGEDFQLVEKKSEKAKPKRVSPSLGKITVEHFQARLRAVDDLEPEYIAFYAKQLNDVDNQKAASEKEISMMRKEVAEKNAAIRQYNDKLSAAQKKVVEAVQLQEVLKEERNKHKIFEQTVRTQLNASAQEKAYMQRVRDQLQSELATAREELKKVQNALQSAPPPVDTSAYQKQIDMLKAELATSKKRTSQLETEMSQRMQNLQHLRSEAQCKERQLETLNSAKVALENRLQEVEENAKKEHGFLESKLGSVLKMAEEVGLETTSICQHMIRSQEKAETATKEKEGYVKQINQLRTELSETKEHCDHVLADTSTKLVNMERANTELNCLVETLRAESLEHNKERTKLLKEIDACRKESSAQHDKVIAELKEELSRLKEMESIKKKMEIDLDREVRELAGCRKELEEFREHYNKKLDYISKLEEQVAEHKNLQMSSQLTEDAKQEEASLNGEVMKQKRVQKAEKTPSEVAASSNDATRLLDEISSLRNENEELRSANYKVVEISKKQEENFLKHVVQLKDDYEKNLDRFQREASRTLRAIAGSSELPKTPAKCTPEKFCDWLKEAESSFMDNMKAEKVVTKREKGDKASNNSTTKSNAPEVNACERRYRAVLATLSSAIDVIEKEVAAKEEAYLSEIRDLRREINKHLRVELEEERKREQELTEQAAKLREIIREPEGNAGKRVEDGWEVIA